MRLRNIIFIFVFILHASVLHAFEGEFTPINSKIIEVEEGATFDGVIRIWPVSQNVDISNFDKIKNGKLNGYFYLIEKSSAKRSSFNSEVVEITGLFAVVKAVKDNSKIKIKIDEKEIVLDIRRITSIATAPAPQNFEFIEQPSKIFSKHFVAYYFAIAIFILFLCIAIVKILIRSKRLKRLKLERKVLIEKILKASERNEIELVANDFKKLGLDENSNSYMTFVKFLETIQYKEKWEKSELSKIVELKNEVINAGL